MAGVVAGTKGNCKPASAGRLETAKTRRINGQRASGLIGARRSVELSASQLLHVHDDVDKPRRQLYAIAPRAALSA
jgi:hypothetical protein